MPKEQRKKKVDPAVLAELDQIVHLEKRILHMTQRLANLLNSVELAIVALGGNAADNARTDDVQTRLDAAIAQAGATGQPFPGQINPATGQPFTPGQINPATGQPFGQPFPGQINPATGQPFTTGQPRTSEINPATGQPFPGINSETGHPFASINPATGQPWPIVNPRG